ncbi:unnamed protein product, partial [Prorocentrum cordatum]
EEEEVHYESLGPQRSGGGPCTKAPSVLFQLLLLPAFERCSCSQSSPLRPLATGGDGCCDQARHSLWAASVPSGLPVICCMSCGAVASQKARRFKELCMLSRFQESGSQEAQAERVARRREVRALGPLAPPPRASEFVFLPLLPDRFAPSQPASAPWGDGRIGFLFSVSILSEGVWPRAAPLPRHRRHRSEGMDVYGPDACF